MRDDAFHNSGGSGSMASPQLWQYAQAYLDGTYKYTEFFDESLDASQWQYCGSTNWFDELYKTNFSQQYNISMNGGTEKPLTMFLWASPIKGYFGHDRR